MMLYGEGRLFLYHEKGRAKATDGTTHFLVASPSLLRIALKSKIKRTDINRKGESAFGCWLAINGAIIIFEKRKA